MQMSDEKFLDYRSLREVWERDGGRDDGGMGEGVGWGGDGC